MKRALVFTDANFEEAVLSSRTPVLVEFWGSWCPACKMVEPILDELARELDEEPIRIGKLNVDQNPRAGSFCNITGVPAFIVFADGAMTQRLVGARSKKQLLAMYRGMQKCGGKPTTRTAHSSEDKR